MAKSPSKKSKSADSAPPNRRREVIGLSLIATALLFLLALISYSPGDADVLRGSGIGALIDPPSGIENRVGVVGAWLAMALLPGSFGWVSLLFGGLLLAWGWVFFRDRPSGNLPMISVLLGVLSLLIATSVGWFGLAMDDPSQVAAGAWGLTLADILSGIFGMVGAAIVLVLLLSATTLSLIEGDIQGALDRVEGWIDHARYGASDKLSSYTEGRADRKAARLAAAEARKARAEERRAEIQAQKASRAVPPKSTSTPQPAARAKPAPLTPPAPAPPPAAPRPQSMPSVDVSPSVPAASSGDGLTPPRQAPIPVTSDDDGEPIATPDLKVREQHVEKNVSRVKPAEGEDDAAYSFPSIQLLEASDGARTIDDDELAEHKQVLLDKLETYKIEIIGIEAIVGPTVTLYELTPAPGVKIRRITELENDLAMAMAAPGIRMIAPIPGKSAIGVEIPNRKREFVRGRDLIGTETFSESKMELPVPIGKTIEGDTYIEDLAKMPHLLIAGATGSGKSVGLNTLITGLLYKCSPQNLKFVMIDPKKIELTPYRALHNHFIALPDGSEEPIVTDFAEALGVLKSCEKEMENRYDLLSAAAVRGIKDYNKRFAEGKLDPEEDHRHLPYIVVVVDELADLMMTAGKDIEGPIARLAQMARAVGIHLVLATQRPSVDVITGLIKANFPSRMAYQVSSKIDSRTILDQGGAEALMGNGDLLYMNGSRMVRLQGPYVSMEEIEAITEHIGKQPGPGPYMLPAFEEETSIFDTEGSSNTDELDAYFADAARIIVRSQQGSVSLLQRKLSVGYTRAARIVDQLEDAGIVGPFEGSKARQVLVPDEPTLDNYLIELDSQ